MFAILWTATLVSNIGTWMHDVSAAWLMTSLSPSPMVVALVQAATTAAMALFALPAGAMADLFDRKRLLIGLTLVKAALALLLGWLTFVGWVSAGSLLAITFALGICSALMAPVWQSITPSLVPRSELKSAIALNVAGMNVARAIGPSIAGVLIVSAGVASAFFLNAASECAILLALLLWRPPSVDRKQAAEHFVPAMIAGLRYAAHAPDLRVVLLRSAAFFLFASAFWALVPLIARTTLAGDASLYGLMVGAVGAGAVLGAFVMPMIDKRLGPDRMVQLGTAGVALVLLALALAPPVPIALLACAAFGLAWIFVLSSFSVAAQNALPDWVRGRGMSIYGLVFFGAMTIGALTWGAAAQALDVPKALVVAAAGIAIAAWLVRSRSLSTSPLDLTPAAHWPEPLVAAPIENDRGPVMVAIEYKVDPARASAFVMAATELSAERYRDGAYQWLLMQDTADPSVFTEYFLVASWAEHERQHARVTHSDADLQSAVAAYHVGPDKPKVRHFIAASGSLTANAVGVS